MSSASPRGQALVADRQRTGRGTDGAAKPPPPASPQTALPQSLSRSASRSARAEGLARLGADSA